MKGQEICICAIFKNYKLPQILALSRYFHFSITADMATYLSVREEN